MDLFKDIIPSANRKRLDFYKNADDEGKKKLEQEFWMLQRWMSCPSKYKEHYLIMLNELVNSDWSSITKHPSDVEVACIVWCWCKYGLQR